MHACCIKCFERCILEHSVGCGDAQMRVAAIYPDGAGMRIYQPGPNSKGYADKL